MGWEAEKLQEKLVLARVARFVYGLHRLNGVR
jgi:hypothetical protein